MRVIDISTAEGFLLLEAEVLRAGEVIVGLPDGTSMRLTARSRLSPCPLCGTDSPPMKDAPGGFSCPNCEAFFGTDKMGKYIHTGDVVRQLTEAFKKNPPPDPYNCPKCGRHDYGLKRGLLATDMKAEKGLGDCEREDCPLRSK